MGTIKGRIFEGVVVSDKMDKTIVVRVTRRFQHSVYKKQVVLRTQFKAHDEKEVACVGDRVRIIESSPYSKDKNFRFLEVIK